MKFSKPRYTVYCVVQTPEIQNRFVRTSAIHAIRVAARMNGNRLKRMRTDFNGRIFSKRTDFFIERTDIFLADGYFSFEFRFLVSKKTSPKKSERIRPYTETREKIVYGYAYFSTLTFYKNRCKILG